jgi:hypothetical protein
MARFQLKTKVLKQTLAKMKVALKSTALDKRTVYCEITITDDKITLTCPGVTYTVDAETSGMAKVALPYLYLANILKDQKDVEIEASVSNNWLTLGSVKVAAKTTFMESDKILRSVNLPLNYNDADLLKMPEQGFTKEELQFNRLETSFDNAQDKLGVNILKAYKVLRVYGFTYEEIEKLVNQKVRQEAEKCL